jgi:hypothetical protein
MNDIENYHMITFKKPVYFAFMKQKSGHISIGYPARLSRAGEMIFRSEVP